jgi:internalin A
VTDAGLKELAGHETLQMLELENTKVADAGLKDLAGAEEVAGAAPCPHESDGRGAERTGRTQGVANTLSSRNAGGDAGMKELAGLKNLQELHLNDTRVTDAGLKELAGLDSLETLYVGGTEVTGVGLKGLAGPKILKKRSGLAAPRSRTPG